MESILSVLAVLLGAIVGGTFSLIGTERVLRGVLQTQRVQRQEGYVAALRSVQRELMANQDLLQPTAKVDLWLPLQHLALDSFMSGYAAYVADSVRTASAAISRYNALVELNNTSLPSAPALATVLQPEIQARATALREQLRAAADNIELTCHDLDTYLTATRQEYDRQQQLGIFRRWWYLITNPRQENEPPGNFPR